MRRAAAGLLLCVTLVLVAAAGLLTACDDSGDESGRLLPPTATEAPTEQPPTEAPSADALVAIAVNADPSAAPSAVLYAYPAEDAEFVVPAGNWFLLVYDLERGVYRSPAEVVSDGESPLDLEAASEPVPGSDEADQAEAMAALTEFLVIYQAAYLSSLAALSNDFDLPLLDPAAAPSPDDAEALRNLLYELDAESDPAMAAIDVLGARPGVAGPAAPPAAGLFDWLKSKIKDVVGGKDRAAKAVSDLLLAAERMTAQQREAAFQAIRDQTGFSADAPDAETFFDNLANGGYDNQAAQIRNYLQNHEDFFLFFDKRNIETAREEGAALVVAGAQFYADAIKQVLDKVFPGIGKGWELVEKLEEKLQQVKDPSRFIIRTVINQYLDEHGYELNDEEVDQLVTAISDAVARVRSGASPPASEPTRASEGEGEYGVFDAGYFGIMVGKQGEIEQTLVCNLHGGGLCEGENAEKVLGPVSMVLGPFKTEEEAVQAYCDNIVPGTYRQLPLGLGPAATMAYDGQEHPVDNAPACE